MMTGEQILEILPQESRKGKVVGRHFDEWLNGSEPYNRAWLYCSEQ